MAILFAVALITGMSVSGSGIDLFGLVGLAYIVNIGAGLFAAGIALRFRTIQAGPLMQTPVFLILFLAPVYVPLSLLTGWIHAVASVNPVTAILERLARAAVRLRRPDRPRVRGRRGARRGARPVRRARAPAGRGRWGVTVSGF